MGWLTVLVPTNESIGSLTNDVGGTLGTATEVSKGVWSTGDLETFLGFPNASPNNPIGAYNAGQDTVDPTATAFNVYTVNLGSTTILHTLAGDPMDLTLSGLPNGAIITGFLVQGTVGNQNTIDTANSSVLMVSPFLASTPLPGTIWMFAGGLGLLGMLKRRKQKQSVSAFA